MLVATSAIKGYAIEASDGRIGAVSDLLFDDQSWKFRWLVVDTGGWLTGRNVLIHPSVVSKAAYDAEQIRVNLTKAQVLASPEIAEDAPVSQRHESRLYEYYGFDPYWGSSYFIPGAMASPLSPPPYLGAPSPATALGPSWTIATTAIRICAALLKSSAIICARPTDRLAI